MVIVLLTILIGCISVYLQKGLEVSSKTKHMMISAIVVTITSISLNIIFIPLYGVSVSIIIGLFAQVLYSFLIVIKSNKILKIDAKKIYLPQFICFLILSFLIKLFAAKFNTTKVVNVSNNNSPNVMINSFFMIKKLDIKQEIKATKSNRTCAKKQPKLQHLQ